MSVFVKPASAGLLSTVAALRYLRSARVLRELQTHAGLVPVSRSRVPGSPSYFLKEDIDTAIARLRDLNKLGEGAQ